MYNKYRSILCLLTILAPLTAWAAGDFYDQSVLYTLELTFEQMDWWQQLEANYASKENILADLTVDGVVYSDVGVRFRGNTSYITTENTLKAPFNIEIDYVNEDQRLMGYKTLNLINAAEDPTFMREVLYSNTCRQQIPSAKGNFIKLVINGENWGVYANIQQINAELIKDWFPSNDGTRWRAQGIGGGDGGGTGGGNRPPPGNQGPQTPPVNPTQPAQPGGGTEGGGVGDGSAALTWLGDDPNIYEAVYELKNSKLDEPWTGLIQACDVLNNMPLDELTTELDTVLNMDRALWLCAFEIIFHDDDGYVHKRGSDYCLYYEPETERLHLIQYDGNSCMRSANNNWSLFYRADDANVPIMNRLLAIPTYRQRYLAHVRTVLDFYLTEERLYPMIDAYQALIEEEVTLDEKKLESTAEFFTGVDELKDFIQIRRSTLLTQEEVNVPTSAILSVNQTVTQEEDGQSLALAVEVGNTVPVAMVQLYLADTPYGPFVANEMTQESETVYRITLPIHAPGTVLRYYVEATAENASGTITYSPPGAEYDVYTYIVSYGQAENTPIVINELMAKNESTLTDPQGQYNDWLELYNRSEQTVDISGMYLSDKPENPLKWQFPEGTTMEAGTYLLVWADEDSGDQGLHANFKLSSDGETVWLYDTDENGNLLLDSVVFSALQQDQSAGRLPDGQGNFQVLVNPTPLATNQSQQK